MRVPLTFLYDKLELGLSFHSLPSMHPPETLKAAGSGTHQLVGGCCWCCRSVCRHGHGWEERGAEIHTRHFCCSSGHLLMPTPFLLPDPG